MGAAPAPVGPRNPLTSSGTYAVDSKTVTIVHCKVGLLSTCQGISTKTTKASGPCLMQLSVLRVLVKNHSTILFSSSFFYPVFRFANQSEQAEEGVMFVSTVIWIDRCVDDQWTEYETESVLTFNMSFQSVIIVLWPHINWDCFSLIPHQCVRFQVSLSKSVSERPLSHLFFIRTA